MRLRGAHTTFYTVIKTEENRHTVRYIHPFTGQVKEVAETFDDPTQASEAFTKTRQGKIYPITNAEFEYIVNELQKVIIVTQLQLWNKEQTSGV